jgi:hypothetical protein
MTVTTEQSRLIPQRVCTHQPGCPATDAPDRDAAQIAVTHPEQGWTLLCNGIVLFDDTGELLPDGRSIAPHRPTDRQPVMTTA